MLQTIDGDYVNVRLNNFLAYFALIEPTFFVFKVSQAQLNAVGVDVNAEVLSITDEQLESLMQMLQETGAYCRPTTASAPNLSVVSDAEPPPPPLLDGVDEAPHLQTAVDAEDLLYANATAVDDYLAYVDDDDGSISIVEDKSGETIRRVSGQQTVRAHFLLACDFQFDRAELLRAGIGDAAQLTSAQLDRLMHDARAERVNDARRSSPSAAAVRPPPLRSGVSTQNVATTRAGARATTTVDDGGGGKLNMKVLVRRRGDLASRPAVVRFARRNGTFKVQYDEDATFEWVTRADIVSSAARARLMSPPHLSARTRGLAFTPPPPLPPPPPPFDGAHSAVSERHLAIRVALLPVVVIERVLRILRQRNRRCKAGICCAPNSRVSRVLKQYGAQS